MTAWDRARQGGSIQAKLLERKLWAHPTVQSPLLLPFIDDMMLLTVFAFNILKSRGISLSSLGNFDETRLRNPSCLGVFSGAPYLGDRCSFGCKLLPANFGICEPCRSISMLAAPNPDPLATLRCLP